MKVWIGDLGYVLTSKEYHHVLDKCHWGDRWDNKYVDNEWIGNPIPLSQEDEDELLESDDYEDCPVNRHVFLLATWNGDGRFKDDEGREYCVDSGQICMILVDDIDESMKDKMSLRHDHEEYEWNFF